MKKLAACLALAGIFGAGAIIGLSTSSAQAGPCYWRCICSVPHKCCSTPTGTSCKVDKNAPISCPQVQDC